MTFEKVRAASMGLGRWANVLADAAKRGGKIDLVSCFSRTEEKRKIFMECYDTRAASSFEEFLKDDEIEAVILTTPNYAHREHIEAISDSGKHIYCEKPIAHSLEDSKKIVETVSSSGIKLAVGHSARRLSICREMKSLVDNGALGKISMNESNFCTERGLELTPGLWRSDPALNPTGVVIQLSIHHIDTLRFMHGPIKEVTAVLRSIHTKADVEDASMIVMEHDSGVISYVGSGWSCPWAFHMNIHGTEGIAHFRITGQQWRDPSKSPVPIRLHIDRDPLGEDTVSDMVEGDMFRDALEDFAICVREDRSPEVDEKIAHESLAVVHAASESSKSRKTVSVKDFL
ncbi:MAG: Gfo/Idh/MocA family oxidoreductase [Nitrospinota bacterium]|nr:Gfo/Idh/MocA family oxidoreductase [Nitrospinota bacterium]